MPHPSKRKGDAGERELVDEITQQVGEVGIVSRTGYMQSGDNAWFDLFMPGIGIEVKRYSSFTEADKKAAWKQAFEAMGQHGMEGKVIPVVAYRADRQPWFFIVPEVIEYRETLEIWDDISYSSTMYLQGFCYWWREVIAPRLAGSVLQDREHMH